MTQGGNGDKLLCNTVRKQLVLDGLLFLFLSFTVEL